MTRLITTNLTVLAVCYTGVLAATLIDLSTGLHRARREGRRLTSRGLRHTVRKLTSYYSALFALTGVDLILIAAAIGLRMCGGEGFAPFPYLSVLGAAGEGIIEAKSVFENIEHKVDLKQALGLIRKIVSGLKY